MKHDPLEYKILFAVTVAGKSAKFAKAAMSRFDDELAKRFFCYSSRFAAIGVLHATGKLREAIESARMGNYAKLTKAFAALAYSSFDLRTISVEQLESIPGIGPKTSRFFLRWSGRRLRIAVLDVHILRWLAERGHKVPKSTPPSKSQYDRVELLFLAEADAMGVHPADLDEQLWLQRNKSGIRT